MSFISSILLIAFLPIQLLTAGYFLMPPEAGFIPSEKIEGASDSKEVSENKLFKETIASTLQSKTALNEQGYIPQRNKNFHETTVFAGSSVVIDVDSGTILHYDKGRDHVPIASLTKIMTAVMIMENAKDLNEPVTIDNEAIMTDGTKVGCPTSVLCSSERLHLGEEITVKNLLTAMLIDSANDAAVALGKHIAGSQKAFAAMMNEKARELNLADSHFCNPSGLDEEGCYSSAYDLTRIAAYSMRYDTIWKIMNMQTASIKSCDGEYDHQLKNTDILLDRMPNCVGGKTGFTYNAGKSLMIAAADPETGKHKIIAVILNDDDRWVDMQNLIDWTFASYDWK
jgi:serine-type D-Ala-D-Ala carboxypeptidase (penicillin-binding protein 5/6)